MIVPFAVPLLALAACGSPQDPKQQVEPVRPQDPPATQAPAQPPTSPDAQKVLDEMKAQFAKEGVVLDAKAQTVTVPAVVNSPPDPIEYLLIHKKGKRHEAVFVTSAKPSVLNAALLLLGLQTGKNASYVEKQPPPTLEEVQKGADPLIVTPPQGQPFWMTVRWKTPEGKVEEHCVEDMILDLGKQKSVAGADWVYLGGRMAQIYKNEPEVYIADYEGNLISICYLSPDNHLATMVHADARDDQNWWTTTLVPPPETPVEFVFHKNRTPLHTARDARLAKEAAAEKEQAAKEAKDGKDGKTDKAPQPEPRGK
jgi:hypothetical protein